MQWNLCNEDIYLRDEIYILKCPDYGGVLFSEGVVLSAGFFGVELGPEDVSLLDRCPLLGHLRDGKRFLIMEVS